VQSTRQLVVRRCRQAANPYSQLVPTDSELLHWLNQYLAHSRSKSEIERTQLDDGASHGKRITALWRDRLGVETEEEHHLVTEINRLKAILDEHDIAY
jgi:hypothetical protein